MIRVKCRLFGRFRLDLSTGQSLDLKGKKGPALIAYLLACENNSEQRDVLVKLLWPRSSINSGKASLRQTMSDLRRQFSAVGLDMLNAHPNNIDIVLLNNEQIESDIREFKQLAETNNFANFECMLHCYQGEFMQGFEIRDSNYMKWVHDERRAFENILVNKFKELDPPDKSYSNERISQMAMRILEIDQTCEEAYQNLIRCALDEGNYATAMQHYKKCEKAVAEAHQVNLSDESQDLYLKIVNKSGSTESSQSTQSASQTANTLTGSRESTTLAVLSFDHNQDNDTTAPLFSEISTELSIAINKFKWISVLNKASTIRLEQEQLSQTALEELQVHYVLSGSARVVDQSMIVNVDLTEPNSNTSIWSEKFECKSNSLLESFDDIIARVACRVDLQLRTTEIRRVIALNSNELSTPELTLLGIHYLFNMTQSSFRTSYDLLQQAILQNPNYSPSYSWLSYWEIFFVGQRWADSEYELTSSAEELTKNAIRHNPEDALALAISGHFNSFLHCNFDAALSHFRRSLILNPYSAFAWMLSSATYSYIGEPEEAIKRLDKAQALCPIEPHFDYLYSSARCVAHIFAGNYDESIKWGRRSVTDNPTFSNGIKQLLVGLGHLNHQSESAAYLEKLLELEPGFTITEFLEKYPAKDRQDLLRLAQGLRKAGVPEK